ncbi:AAA family ATPase [Streptomyces sp. NPDC059618]|uniref:ATP-binding protein n=1 Tax=Streptomyces sp. NPDC059618 TaxID=3346887 RepID=UPI0036985CF7
MTLAGRTAAIRTLTDAFTDSTEGCFRTVVVEGPAGCGKSALVHGLVERAAAAGAVVLCAAGSPAGDGALQGAIRRAAAWQRGHTAMRRAPGGQDVPSLCAGLIEAGGGRPLVLCVDDVHHADAESLAVLRRLTGRMRPARTLLVVAGTVPHEAGNPVFAEELTRRPATRRIRLEPLGPAEVGLLAERAGRGGQAAFLHEASGGNPLLLDALLTSPDPAARTAPRRPFPDPDSLFARAVQACLHRCGARAAAIARAAVLLEDTATPGRIAQLTGIAPAAVRQGLAGLAAAGLLDDTRLPRPAVRAVVLATLSATTPATTRPAPAPATTGRPR